MPGPSIRNWELAHVLSTRHQVTLAAPGEPDRTSDRFRVAGYDDASLAGLVAEHEVVQAYGDLLERHPVIGSARHLVVDLYDPFPLENLHIYETRNPEIGHRVAARDREVLLRLVQAGDVFLCASDRQRDFWTGWLLAAGRVNPSVHAADPALEGLLRLVPFGVPDEPPQPGPPRFRGVVPGIDWGDFVVLWGGGVWNWFDPLTLVRAAASVRERLPRLRLVFPALGSPSPASPPMAMAEMVRRLSDELGLTGSVVFFGGDWVPYAERGSLLLEADVGVSLHQEGVETRYSFRTRVLDYLWAGLPILTTEGDAMADLVRGSRLGEVVPYGDVDAVAEALRKLARRTWYRQACARRSREASERFRWSEVARPLLAYCDAPVRAPDHGKLMPLVSWPHPEPERPSEPDDGEAGAEPPPPDPEPLHPRRESPNGHRRASPWLLSRVASAYQRGGLPLLATKGAARLRRLWPERPPSGPPVRP